MKKKTAVLLVGHSNWGKSRTLRALTNGRLFQGFLFNGRHFFIRRMSNDDSSAGYRIFVDSCVRNPNTNILAAFCPHFAEGDPRHSRYTLESLQELYTIRMFVLRHRYGGPETVTDAEIGILEGFGEVLIHAPRNDESPARAAALLEFINAG